LHLTGEFNRDLSKSYDIIWNFRKNSYLNIDTTNNNTNKYNLYNNIILETCIINDNLSYKILNLKGEVIEKVPIGYQLAYGLTTDEFLIFNNDSKESFKKYILFNFKNNKLNFFNIEKILKVTDHYAITFGETKGDLQEINAIDLTNNVVVGHINVQLSTLGYVDDWGGPPAIDFLPYLKTFIYYNKNKPVFANTENKKIAANYYINGWNYGLLNENYYLQSVFSSNNGGILNSCIIWKIDTNQFSAFDLKEKYRIAIDTSYTSIGEVFVLQRDVAPYCTIMGYSPDEKYIIVSDEITKKITLWNNKGKKLKEIPFLSGAYKFSKSGKYLALNSVISKDEIPVIGEFRLYSFPAFKLLYSEPSFASGIEFKESKDTLCVLYAGNSMKYVNNKYQKKNEWKIGNLQRQINMYNHWLYIKDGLLYTQGIGDKNKYCNLKVFDYQKRDSIILFSDSSINFNSTHTLITDNKNVIINIMNSIQINDFKNNMLFNLKNKGDISFINPYNDSIIFIVYMFANEYRIVSPENPDTFRIGLRRTPNYFIEMWDIYNNKMLYKKGMAGSCENFSFYKERMLMNYGSDYLYADLKCNSIIEFQGEGNQRSAISPQGNYFVYLDNKNKHLVSFPLNPKEVIRRVRVDKEFGEMRQLTDEEKQEYGIDE